MYLPFGEQGDRESGRDTIPAVAWLLYTVFFTIMALLAAPSAPLIAIIYTAMATLIIWGTTTIILLILEKPAKNAKYALPVVIVILVLDVLGGLDGVEELSELVFLLAALSLLAVTVYLLRLVWRDSSESSA